MGYAAQVRSQNSSHPQFLEKPRVGNASICSENPSFSWFALGLHSKTAAAGIRLWSAAAGSGWWLVVVMQTTNLTLLWVAALLRFSYLIPGI